MRMSESERFNHLRSVISSKRFLQMRGLNNDLPFYVCDFDAAQAAAMQKQVALLVRALGNLSVPCLGNRGVQVLEVNLYDLVVDMLKAREGGPPGNNLWEQILAVEADLSKDELLELLQNVLDVEQHLVPAIGERLQQAEHDVMFLTGIGEVFPYIRSHNVLNNLQSTAKDKPTVMFFPGEYRHTLLKGASLELFGRLHDDKYYRAFNIYEVHA